MAVQGGAAGRVTGSRVTSAMAILSPHKRSAERQQIADDVLALPVPQAKCRHEAARLGLPGVSHPAQQFLVSIVDHVDHARAQRLPAHQVRQVGPEATLRGSAAYPMAVDARLGKESGAPGVGSRVLRARLLLVLQPTLKDTRGIDDDANEHIGVLRTAILGTLADVPPGPVRLKPHAVDASR